MSFLTKLKRQLIGPPLPTSAQALERVTNVAGLAILSSDALSSVAYATEETLRVLMLAGSSVLGLSIPIAVAITALLTIVTLSYRQTIRAYPSGGGAYIVAHENLGLYPGLIAAAALMIDYVLTVTVSVAAGSAALTSAIPSLQSHTVELCIVSILILMTANLRGLRAAGKLFMLPTYTFILSIFLLIVVGFFHAASETTPVAYPVLPFQEPFSLFLLFRAFASGCTAMTGVEAISNGVMVFKSPEWKNARLTMLYMSAILGSMFLGITYLAHQYRILPTSDQTVLSSLGHQVFGNNPLYYCLQAATLLILLLAANTSYSDFPRLSSLLAKDSFLPRQLMLLGDRLVYSNGIILLSILAIFLVVIFRGNVNAIIPLYAVGVFTSFTLSQVGMVRHWFKERTSGWRTSAAINGVGAIATLIVLSVIIITKFALGAWLIVIAIPLVVVLFTSIHRHYHDVAQRLKLGDAKSRAYASRPQFVAGTHPAVVLVGQLHKGTVEALDYARTIADEIVAVHVDIGYTNRAQLQQQWQQLESDIPLVILYSPYRSIIEPIVNFVSSYEAQYQGAFSTVIIPTFVTRHWWENVLHNQSAYFLKAALRDHKSRVVTMVQYYL